MKNKEFDNLIRNLSNQKPEQQDAEWLTDSIMNSINAPQKKAFSFLYWTRICSGMAAMALIGLFVWEQNGSTKISESEPTKIATIQIDSICLENYKLHNNALKTYICHLSQNTQRNRKLQTYRQLSNN